MAVEVSEASGWAPEIGASLAGRETSVSGKRPRRDGEELAWQSLVTQAHVRAARLRRSAKLLNFVGALCAVVGFTFAFGFSQMVPYDFGTFKRAPKPQPSLESPGPAPRSESPEAKVLRVFDELAAPITIEDGNSTVPDAIEVARIRDAILKGLQNDDRLPDTIRTLESGRILWRGDWPAGEVVWQRNQDVVAAAAIVRLDPEAGEAAATLDGNYVEGSVRLLRWIGIFSKQDGTWTALSIKADNFFGPRGSTYIGPSEVEDLLVRLIDGGESE